MYRRRSERLLSNNLKKQTEQNRRMSFIMQYPAMTAAD